MQNKNGFWASELRPTQQPQRIISTVPSQTELLFYFGLEKEVVGITLFCVHPKKWHQSKQRIGGTKQLKINTIINLKPDLILANKEENKKEQIEQLAEHFPTYVTDVNNIKTALQMIDEVGEIIHQKKIANELSTQLSEQFSFLQKKQLKRCCYLIWKDPYMTIGGDTFISDMLLHAGFKNVFSHKKRYPEITLQELKSLELDTILLSSEPFPFKEEHCEELRKHLPNTLIQLVDGELFSWYGSRMLKALSFFKTI